PLLNFPEISMWGLYPWGGWGATALPERITRFWRQTGDKLSGGFLYSEGLFEDINKVIVAQLYFWGDRDPDETLREYAIYELGMADAAPFLELVHTLEKTHTAVATAGMCDLGDVARTYELACEIDEALPQWAKRCFRWRQIFLRAVLDSRRYPACFARFGKMRVDDEDWKALLREDEVCIEAFRELVGIYHSVDDFEEDPYHRRVRPLLS
ncbi:MAG: hypothetical protein GX620_17655, partial [Chloroflexi bacterium]|nr:hypothetical protein [Chloroflexota bacterium]